LSKPNTSIEEHDGTDNTTFDIVFEDKGDHLVMGEEKKWRRGREEGKNKKSQSL
jgi:hypothetical protein